MATKHNLLIVFTDEVGSTSHQEIMTPEEVKNSTVDHFTRIVNALYKTTAQIVKNIGDSLLIKYEEEDLIKIISALAKCRHGGTRKIRIAAHLEKKDNILQGNDVKLCLEDRLEAKKLNIWPKHVFESLKFDIFGRGVNLAARFAGVPREDIFIISDSVFEEILRIGRQKNLIEKDLSLQEIPFAFTSQLLKGIRISPPIPIVYLKGLQAITYSQPRYVREVVKIDNNGSPTFQLHSDQKIINNITIIKFHSTESMSDPKRLSKLRWEYIASKILPYSLETNLDFPHPNTFYNDLCFEIYGFWHFNLEEASKADLSKILREIKKTNEPKKGDLPLFAIFNSFPNEGSEERHREFIDVSEAENKGFYTMIRTYRVWKEHIILDCFMELIEKGGKKRPEKGKKLSAAAVPMNKFYSDNAIFKVKKTEESHLDDFFMLIIFKINPITAKYATTPEELFKDLKLELETIKAKLVSFGSVRGEQDGYILYWVNQDTLDYSKIIEAILGECVNPPSYLKNHAAELSLYFLRTLYVDEYIKMNIRTAHELGSKRLSNWQQLRANAR